MQAKRILAAFALAATAMSAQAEGSHNLDFTFLLYALVALAVMAGQALFVLFTAGTTLFGKLGFVLLLGVLDVCTVGVLYKMSEARMLDLEGMLFYALATIPGFIFCAMAKTPHPRKI